MATPFVISSRVIDTVNSLPPEDRISISAEFILGNDPSESLTPMQNMLYAMIRFYVVQDTERSVDSMASGGSPGVSIEPGRCALG